MTRNGGLDSFASQLVCHWLSCSSLRMGTALDGPYHSDRARDSLSSRLPIYWLT